MTRDTQTGTATAIQKYEMIEIAEKTKQAKALLRNTTCSNCHYCGYDGFAGPAHTSRCYFNINHRPKPTVPHNYCSHWLAADK